MLWDTIKQGVPFGAYVKNRAKDGRYYWVFAIVTPVEGGYLSVRLRPSSDLFAVIKQEYPALSAIERRDRLAPADSATILLQRLGELGFPNYPAFMAAALGRELAARDERLRRPRDRSISQFDELVGTAQSLLKQADIIAAAYASNENVPFNFRVLAAQLGQDGAAIGVISTNYTLLSTEMKSILTEFVNSAQEVFRTINEGYFLACTARGQRELLDFFGTEENSSGLSREQEMALLDRQQMEYRAKAAAGLTEIARKAAGFKQTCLDMNRLAAALEVTRVLGKMECARHTEVKDRMDELLNDLESFQKTIAAALKELDHMNEHIRREADDLLACAKAAA